MGVHVIVVVFIIPVIFARFPMHSEGKIRHFLLNQANHSARERPVLNSNDSVNVGLQVQFYAMLDLNERDQIITTAAWLVLNWKDERLTWNPKKFDGVDLVVMFKDEIWIPRLFLSNSVSEGALGIIAPNSGSILLTSEGHVYLGAPLVQTTQCAISIRYFPFDTQVCPFQYLPEQQTTDQMTFFTEQSIVPSLLDSGEWELLNITHHNVLYPIENYIHNRPVVYYSLGVICVFLKRDPSYYITTLIIPSSLLCVMAFLTFLAPPDSGERISLGVSMVLGLTVFQLLIANTLPTASKETPLIGQYLNANFILACLVLPFSLSNINIAYGDSRVLGLKYKWPRKILLEILPKILCVTSIKERLQGEFNTVKQSKKVKPLKEVNGVVDDIPEGRGDTRVQENNMATDEKPVSSGSLTHAEKKKLEARTVALVLDRILLATFFAIFIGIAIIITIEFRSDIGPVVPESIGCLTLLNE